METPIRITSLHNAQIEKKINDIFSHGKTLQQLQPPIGEKPILIIIGGCPGVGKTSQARHFIRKLGYNYNDFYNISLDGIVENVTPYRIATKIIYDALKEKRGNAPLTEDDLAMLSEVYLGTIMSKKRGLNLSHIVHSILYKIETGQKMEAKKTKKKVEEVEETFPNLIERRKEALHHAMENGLNIIYDTTFSKTNIIQRDMPATINKYDVHVLLITSSENQIRKQLEMRHREMISGPDPFIRAIPPKLIKMFIEDNKNGFQQLQSMYGDQYHFHHIDNLPKRNENNEKEAESSRRSTCRSSKQSVRHSTSRSARHSSVRHLITQSTRSNRR
jgi:hypothetical protein